MSGEYPSEYVAARRVLLDALEALEDHRSSLVLVGAQAVYVYAGEADIAVAAFTTDADVAISPDLISDSPLLTDLLADRGFTATADIGRWVSPEGVYLDLLVPEAVAGPGTRRADLGIHGRDVARRARGLEAALVEHRIATIVSLDEGDERSIDVAVAGPAALIVAKVVKIGERLDKPDRLADKDALDVLRLLRSVPLDELVDGFGLLVSNELSEGVTREAIELIPGLFETLDAPATQMAMRAVRGIEDEEAIGNSLVALAGDLHGSLVG